MNIFYIVRHGDKQKIQNNPGLTDLGVKQAQSTANYFLNKNIQQILTSPLKRTVQTAEIISQTIKVQLKIDKRLTERLDWGSYPDLNFEQFLDLWHQSTKERDFQPNNGNSSIETGKRLESLINELSQKYPGKQFILVCHAGIINDFIHNVFPSRFKPNEEIHIPTGSITIIKKSQTCQIEKIGFIPNN